MSPILPTVLLVVDDFSVRLDLADGLEVAGFSVLEAADADAALAILGDRSEIRVLVTEIGIPGSMSGARLAAAAIQRRRSVKIIVMSGETVSPAVPEGSQLLQAPYGRTDVTKAVRSILVAKR